MQSSQEPISNIIDDTDMVDSIMREMINENIGNTANDTTNDDTMVIQNDNQNDLTVNIYCF